SGRLEEAPGGGTIDLILENQSPGFALAATEDVRIGSAHIPLLVRVSASSCNVEGMYCSARREEEAIHGIPEPSGEESGRTARGRTAIVPRGMDPLRGGGPSHAGSPRGRELRKPGASRRARAHVRTQLPGSDRRMGGPARERCGWEPGPPRDRHPRP